MTYDELYPNSKVEGIGLIYELSSLSDCPWLELSEDKRKSLERMFNLKSTHKRVFESFSSIPDNNRASMILTYNYEKWNKYWNTFKLTYNPLNAYNVLEIANTDRNGNATNTINYGREENVLSLDKGSVEVASNGTSNNVNGVYGFNSVNAVNSDESDSSNTDTSTETRNLSDSRATTNSGSDKTVSSTEENTIFNSKKEGNIGYTSPQELLESEFELWSTPFFETIFRDISNIIFLKIYG